MAIGKTNAVSGKKATLIPKSITTNGTYLPNLENADGYSSVIVNVNSSPSSEYQRPNDWLEIPTLDTTKDDIYILNGVGDFNQLMFKVVATGNVTVDWGDGITESDTSNMEMVFAHTYNYDEISDETYTQHNKTKQVLVHIYADRNTIKLFDMTGDYYFTNADNVRVKYQTNASTNVYEVKANVQECAVWCLKSGNYLRHKNLEIFDWAGSITNTSMNSMFSNCSSLQTIPNLDTSNVTNMSYMFSSCYSLQSISNLDTSNVTNMSYMFSSCYSLQTIPNLDTSNVTSMNSMFSNCSSLQSISNLDTSNVTNMSSMFNYCYSLQLIPQLDTSNVTNMSSMFNYCYSLQTIPNLDTSNVTSMNSMFSNCSSLQTIPNLDTSNVTNMSYMFSSCYSLQSISNLDTSNVTNMSYMFSSCYSLQSISNLDTSNVTNMSYMFSSCYSLQTIPNLDTSNVTNMSYMFRYCFSLQIVPNIDTSNVTNMSYMFSDCYSLQNPQLYKANKSFNISNCTMMTKQQIVDLINSISSVGDTQTITLGTTLQGYMEEVYVRPLENEHPSFYFMTEDIQPVDGKAYYTYNEIDKTYILFTGDTFDSDTIYYELVYNDEETKYEICDSGDSSARQFTYWVTNEKGWTIA